jgi:hypothetical protein
MNKPNNTALFHTTPRKTVRQKHGIVLPSSFDLQAHKNDLKMFAKFAAEKYDPNETVVGQMQGLVTTNF